MKKDGFSEIYDIYFPKLLRFTRTYLISEDESENIVQEIFDLFVGTQRYH